MKKNPVSEQIDAKKKDIAFMTGLYQDFKKTFKEVLGDAGEVWEKHKLLIIIAFIAFLIYRNRALSIKNALKELEERLKENREW